MDSREKLKFLLDRASQPASLFHAELVPGTENDEDIRSTSICLMCEAWSLEFKHDQKTLDLTFDVFFDHVAECILGEN